MTTASDIIALWKATPNSLGVADDLRCMAWEIQEEYPHIGRKQFLEAAVAAGYNQSTASRCWSYVRGQDSA